MKINVVETAVEIWQAFSITTDKRVKIMKSEDFRKLRKSKLMFLETYNLCSNFDRQSVNNGGIFTNKRHL